MKEAAEGPVFGEGDVALEEEVIKVAGDGRLIIQLMRKYRAITEKIVVGADLTKQMCVGGIVVVTEIAETIGEPVENRAKHRGETVVEPFGEEINSNPVAGADVGADVEKVVGVKRMREEPE